MRQGVPQLIKELVGELDTVLRVAGQVGNHLLFPISCQLVPIAVFSHVRAHAAGPYLNNALHEVGLVIGQLARGLVLNEILDGVDIAEAQGLDVIEETRGLVVLEVGAVAGLVGQRLARGVDGLRILLEHGDNLGPLHGVVVLIVGSGLARRRDLGEALAAVLLGLWLGVAIGAVLVPLELSRKSPQHGDD